MDVLKNEDSIENKDDVIIKDGYAMVPEEQFNKMLYIINKSGEWKQELDSKDKQIEETSRDINELAVKISVIYEAMELQPNVKYSKSKIFGKALKMLRFIIFNPPPELMDMKFFDRLMHRYGHIIKKETKKINDGRD